jgi:replicative DNA helicase
MSLPYRPLAEVWIDAATVLVDPPKGIPLPWWPTFTHYTGGLRPNELTLLCAPTGAGKTQLLANLSAQLLIQDVPHFVAPVETGDVDFVVRVISVLEGKDFNTGDRFSIEQIQALTTKHEDLLKRNLFIATYDNRVDVREMINMLTFMHQEHGCQVALLDNLNFFLKVTSAQNERAEMDNAVHEFVMHGKKIPMHKILVVHPKKTDGGRVESEFDIKGSSTAVQEASNVLMFNRPKTQEVDDKLRHRSEREAVFRKIRRRGQYVGYPIWFEFKGGKYTEAGGRS